MNFELMEISGNDTVSDCFPDFFDNCNPTEEQDCMPNGYPDPDDGEDLY